MEAWWNSLGTALQVYYGIAIVATFLLFLQLLLTLLGFDGDGDFDVDLDADVHDAGVSVLSVRSVSAFFAGFGWGGVVAVREGLSLFGSTVAATLAGGVLMAMVVGLMRGLYAMRGSGTLNYRNAVGVVGDVYLPIPPNMEGPGQVEVLVQGRLAVVQAFTRADRRLPNRTRVRVIDTLDPTTLVVEPLAAPAAAPDASSQAPAEPAPNAASKEL